MRRPLCLLLLLIWTPIACDSDPTALQLDEVEPEGSSAAAAATGVQAGGDGDLINGDMEEAAGWWFHGPPGSEQGYAASVARSGTRSIRISRAATSGPGQFSFAGQHTPVQDPSGKRYTLSVRVKLEGVTGQGVAVALRGDVESAPTGQAEAFATTQGKVALTGTTDWVEVVVEMDGLGEDIQSIAAYLILLSESAGTVYFDDAELHVSDWDLIRTIQNGGFEDGLATPGFWWRGGEGYERFDFRWEDGESWEGTRSASISRSSSSSSEFAYWAQTIFAQDFLGEAATLRVRIKTELVGEGAAILVRGDDSYQPLGSAEVAASSQGRVAITGTRDWTEYSVTLNRVPFNMKSLTVYLIYGSGTTGKVFFDGVSLSR